MISLRYALGSDTGHVRSGNEDAAYAGPHLVAVADGMGGHAHGEVASRAVISVIARLDDDVPGSDLLSSLQGAVDEAQAHLADMVAANPDLRGMGTTLTAVLVSEGRLGLVHVGDSRGYLLRDGQLAQITHDHTYVQELVDLGEITPEEASAHPRRSLILRALDGINPVEADLRLREARVGDRYLLCSDGLSSVVTASTLAEALATPDRQGAADRLVELALRAGGPDNITVAVVDVVDAGSQEPDEGPVVAGAASLDPDTGVARTGAAGRAASALGRVRKTRVEELEPLRDRRWMRPGVVVVLLLALLLGGGYTALRVWLQSQWYVGVRDGHVTVYQGVPGSVVGYHLQRAKDELQDVSTVAPADLDRLQDGISATSRSDARRIASGLSLVTPTTVPATVPSPSPSPSPTPSPSPSPTPSPSPSPAASPSPAPASP
jgi:protein phosphatase